MTDELVVLERYYRRECLEILGIPAEVGDEDIEKKILEVLDAISAQLTQIWFRTVIVYPLKASPKKLF